MCIVVTSATSISKYRDGQGIVREEPTGCRDETAARQVLADLEWRAERIRAKFLSTDEDKALSHQETDIGPHFDAFLHTCNKGRCSRPKETQAQLRRVAEDCGFRRLADVDAEKFERWLVRRG